MIYYLGVTKMQTKLSDGSIMVCGTLPKDAEYKTVGVNDSSLTKFGLKVGEKPSASDPDKKEAVWANCECWHSVAKYAATFKKFDTVLCVGKLKSEEYNGKTYTKLICEFVLAMPDGEVTPVIQASQNSANIIADLSDFEELAGDNTPF